MVVGRWSDGSRPPTIGAKISPSRDLIDGSLSLDGFRSGWMAAMAALGQTRMSPARSIGSGGQRGEKRLRFRDLGKFRGRRKALERSREHGMSVGGAVRLVIRARHGERRAEL